MTPRRWTSGRDAVAAWLLGLAVLGLAGPNAARALSSRWREVHTPGSGPERVLAPEVRDLRAALQRAGARAFMFTPALASETAIAPFLVEAYLIRYRKGAGTPQPASAPE